MVLSRSTVVRTLPADALAGVLPILPHVVIALRQPLYNPDAAIEAVYFPETGMISLVANLEVFISLDLCDAAFASS